jgi:predicted GNAT superfamily acetyltransferase
MCIELQRTTWGDDFHELVPPAMLLVTQKVGGVTLGAFDHEDLLVGFVYGITGILDGEPIHWSHMLAVRRDWRDRGIGALLKMAQRDRLIATGVARARWSFDPLVARNAHLNLHRLRARVLEYVEDMYGENPMSQTDSVIGSDRLVVEWSLRTQPLDLSVAGQEDDEEEEGPMVTLKDGTEPALPDEPAVRLEIPRDIQSLKKHDPTRATIWRELTRTVFQHYLDHGYRVVDFRRGRPGARGRYLLVAGGEGP